MKKTLNRGLALSKRSVSNGFTLIELLVVIAIIGILAGIVLTSLGTARNKGKIASAVSSMSAMRSEAELGVNSNGQYLTGLCATATTGTGSLGKLMTAVKKQTSTDVTCTPATDYRSWAAIVSLTELGGSGATANFCVDSSGFSGNRKGADVLTTGITPNEVVTCPTT